MLGIDVSKARLSYTLLDEASGGAPLCQGSVPNTPHGIGQLLGTIPPTYAWVLEPTGRYGELLVDTAQAAGRTVLLAPPERAMHFLHAIHPRAKTDRLDSLGLAQYAQAVALRPYPRKSALVDELSQLLAARRGLTQSRMRLRQQRRELPAAAESLERVVASLTAEQQRLDQQLKHLVRGSELAADVARLQSVPGIGLVTSISAVCTLRSKEFAHAEQFVAYIGLDVRVRESGRWRGQARLSKRGHSELRRLFYCCAQANLRRREPTPFTALYQREREKGRPSTAALNVVARKLATTCWALIHHQQSYDPMRVGRQG